MLNGPMTLATRVCGTEGEIVVVTFFNNTVHKENEPFLRSISPERKRPGVAQQLSLKWSPCIMGCVSRRLVARYRKHARAIHALKIKNKTVPTGDLIALIARAAQRLRC